MNLSEYAARAESSTPDPLRVLAFIPSKGSNRPASEVRRRALAWFERRFGHKLPEGAETGKDVKAAAGNRSFLAAAARAINEDIWACRLSVPVKGRLITEAVICSAGGRVTRLGFRLLADAPAKEFIEKELAGPLASLCELYASVAESSPKPRIVRSPTETDKLAADLLDPRRSRPVIVLSTRKDAERPSATNLDSAELAKSVNGLAQVCVVTSRQTYQLTHRLGRQLAVFNGAARVYMPSLVKDTDPGRHPLRRMEHVLDGQEADCVRAVLLLHAADGSVNLYRAQNSEWPDTCKAVQEKAASLEKPAARPSNAAPQTAAQAAPEVQKRKDRRPFGQPAFSRLKTRYFALFAPGLLKRLDGAKTEIVELRSKLDVANRKLQESKAARKRIKSKLEEERRQHKKSTDDLSEKLRRESERARELKAELEPLRPLPGSWEYFVAWCDNHFEGKVVLVPAVRQGIANALFEEVQTAAAGVRWLANEYRDCRMNGKGDDLRGRIQDLRSVSNERCGGDSFRFDWQGKRHAVEWHLRKGNSYDPRYCLRIYYFWDTDKKQVVIADMPAHRHSSAS